MLVVCRIEAIWLHLRDDQISVRLFTVFFQPDIRPVAMRSSRPGWQIPYRTLFVKNTVPHGHLFCHIFKLSKISVICLLGIFAPTDRLWMAPLWLPIEFFYCCATNFDICVRLWWSYRNCWAVVWLDERKYRARFYHCLQPKSQYCWKSAGI